MSDPIIPSEAVAVAKSPVGMSYRGKTGCKNITCTRMGLDVDRCYGWHCAYCHGPSNSQGDCKSDCVKNV